MTQITFKVGPGAKIVRKGLQDLAAEVPKIGRQQVRNTLERIKRVMGIYPPERPGQDYVRTFKLRRGWKIESAGPSGYKISNRARFRGRSYVKYVVGTAAGTMQAWMHKGRWPLFRNVVDAEGAKLPFEIARHITIKARKLRL